MLFGICPGHTKINKVIRNRNGYLWKYFSRRLAFRLSASHNNENSTDRFDAVERPVFFSNLFEFYFYGEFFCCPSLIYHLSLFAQEDFK